MSRVHWNLYWYCATTRIAEFTGTYTVYPNKYAHGFVVLCFVVVMQSFIMNSHEVFIHIQQGCFVGTGAIVRLPHCRWSKLDGYGKISQCITTTKHSKAKTVCIFLGIYCIHHKQCRHKNYIISNLNKNFVPVLFSHATTRAINACSHIICAMCPLCDMSISIAMITPRKVS